MPSDSTKQKLLDLFRRFKRELVHIRHNEFKAISEVSQDIDAKHADALRNKLKQP